MGQMRKYFTHTQVLVLPRTQSSWDAEFVYEVDTKHAKYVARENSYIIKVGP